MMYSEWGICECCGEERVIGRTYFHYEIDCECCHGKEHFEIVYHCGYCEAKDPGIRKIELSKELKHKI
jgi:hypothetical protein